MRSNPRKRILVVDDEADVVAYLAAFLGDNGYEVISASDGREGFSLAKSVPPDLVTLDITMPNESGVRMLRDLREDPETAHLPVVIITGISSEFKAFIESRKRLRPPEGYFEKPIDRDALLARIRQLLEQSD